MHYKNVETSNYSRITGFFIVIIIIAPLLLLFEFTFELFNVLLKMQASAQGFYLPI